MANFNKKKTDMNADILKGQWKEFKGEVKQKWGKLTDDELSEAGRKRRTTFGTFAEDVLQKRYGYAKEKANQEFKEFIVSYGKPP